MLGGKCWESFCSGADGWVGPGRAQAVSTASSSTAAAAMTQAEKTKLANHVRREYLHAWKAIGNMHGDMMS